METVDVVRVETSQGDVTFQVDTVPSDGLCDKERKKFQAMMVLQAALDAAAIIHKENMERYCRKRSIDMDTGKKIPPTRDVRYSERMDQDEEVFSKKVRFSKEPDCFENRNYRGPETPPVIVIEPEEEENDERTDADQGLINTVVQEFESRASRYKYCPLLNGNSFN